MSMPADSFPPPSDTPSLREDPSSAPETGRDAKPARAESAVSDAMASQALIGILAALGVGIYLLAKGSVFGAGLLVLGVFYAAWLTAARARKDKAMVVAVALIAVTFILWAIISAAAYHYYDGAVAVGAYGLWAFMLNVHTFAEVKSRRTSLLLVAGHFFALLGFLFVDLSWQLDTAVALAAIVLVLATGVSIGGDQDAKKTSGP